MNKKKIVIVSLLKPLHDPRHYERFALSLAKTNKYDINIIANGEKKPDSTNIKFHTIGSRNRKYFSRLTLHRKAYKLIAQIKPELLIICTVELIPFAIMISIFTRTKVIYDVQENYRLNFRKLDEYGWIHKYLLSGLISLVETLSYQFFNHYFLAEKCYAEQLHFFKSNYTILENKTVLSATEKPKNRIRNRPVKLLYSGTISKYSGVVEILEIIKVLSNQNITFEITIIGQVHDEKIYRELSRINQKNVHLRISKSFIPHDQIVAEIRKADVGIIMYQHTIVSGRKIPTKLYEYAAFGLPYLVDKNSFWYEVGKDIGGAIPVGSKNISAEINSLFGPELDKAFTNCNPFKALWVSEEEKLIKSINTFL